MLQQQQSTDISHLTEPQQKNLQQQVCCCGPMLGQMDGQTPYHFTDLAPQSAYYVDSDNKTS